MCRSSNVIKSIVLSARSIAGDAARAEALGNIATIAAQAGKVAEALKVAQSIMDEDARTTSIIAIAEALARAGHLADGLKAAESIKDPFWRYPALTRIAAAQAAQREFGNALASQSADIRALQDQLNSVNDSLARQSARQEEIAGAVSSLTDVLKTAGWTIVILLLVLIGLVAFGIFGHPRG